MRSCLRDRTSMVIKAAEMMLVSSRSLRFSRVDFRAGNAVRGARLRGKCARASVPSLQTALAASPVVAVMKLLQGISDAATVTIGTRTFKRVNKYQVLQCMAVSGRSGQFRVWDQVNAINSWTTCNMDSRLLRRTCGGSCSCSVNCASLFAGNFNPICST